MQLAPICLFTYNRLPETKQTVKALRLNNQAINSDLYIFSDAPKNVLAIDEVLSVRNFLRTINGFNRVTIIERNVNLGLAKSIISGVTEVIVKYGKVIVLEDDLITTTNFLDYMNEALSFYEKNTDIWSVSGFSFPIKYPDEYIFDAAFGVRASSWGWATWSDRWSKVDWEVSDYSMFLEDRNAQKQFNQGGSDLCHMLSKQMSGQINSWAIRFCYAQFRNKAFDVFPRVSKVHNIGFSESATHTNGMDSRFATVTDKTGLTAFSFPYDVRIDSQILSQFRKPFSLMTRLKYKFLKYFK